MERTRSDEHARTGAKTISRRTALQASLGALVATAFVAPETQAVATGSPPAGDLAYAVKNGDHWDLWVYSFDTQQNTQLTSEPNSDQWAPAYSHNGGQLAYLSDQTDGSNQIWLMNPDGSNKRQITNWYGSESIVGIAWSPDDSQLIVTLFGDMRRLATMPATGGEFSGFVAASSSFASTSGSGALVFASDNGNPQDTVIYAGAFANPGQAIWLGLGDAPIVSADSAYVVVQIGAPGGRSVATYPLAAESAPLPTPPRVGDDSNPVWLTATHDYLAFVSAGVNGESIQMVELGKTSTTALAIAPHQRVWYLSKRPTRERIMF